MNVILNCIQTLKNIEGYEEISAKLFRNSKVHSWCQKQNATNFTQNDHNQNPPLFRKNHFNIFKLLK